jgi:cation transport regulator
MAYVLRLDLVSRGPPRLVTTENTGKESTMPYDTRSELPDSVKDNLPDHAQDIYKEAFNSAWEQYGHDESRAHRVAWGAVEKSYHKNDDGKWVKGGSDDS